MSLRNIHSPIPLRSITVGNSIVVGLLLSAGNIFSDTFSPICPNDTASMDNNETHSENITRGEEVVVQAQDQRSKHGLDQGHHCSSSQITDGRITTPTLSRRAPSMSRCLAPLPNCPNCPIRDQGLSSEGGKGLHLCGGCQAGSPQVSQSQSALSHHCRQ